MSKNKFYNIKIYEIDKIFVKTGGILIQTYINKYFIGFVEI